jgi:hypothetical protein
LRPELPALTTLTKLATLCRLWLAVGVGIREGVFALVWIDSLCGLLGVGWLISWLKTEAVYPEAATVGAL